MTEGGCWVLSLVTKRCFKMDTNPLANSDVKLEPDKGGIEDQLALKKSIIFCNLKVRKTSEVVYHTSI